MQTLWARVRDTLERHRDLPPSARFERLARSAAASLAAPIFLSQLDRVGPRARAFGRPHVDNQGWISVGFEFAMMNAFSPVDLVAMPGARIEMGNNVTINFGSSIVARERIVIGDRASLGPYCVIADDAGTGRIEIGADVWLAARVTVLGGSRIGARSVVSAGSIVQGDIPPDSIASGVPARVLRVFGASDGRTPRTLAPSARPSVLMSSARALRDAAEARASRDVVGTSLWPGLSDPIDSRLAFEGRPFVKNRGRIDWGDEVVIHSRPVQSHIVTGPSGHLRIGSRVVIAHGAALSVMSDVHVGDGTTFDPFVMILDSDYHSVNDRNSPGEPRPIVIGRGVRLGARATILRGVTIGDGAVIEADSVVCRNVPAGAVAAGVPARPVV